MTLPLHCVPHAAESVGVVQHLLLALPHSVVPPHSLAMQVIGLLQLSFVVPLHCFGLCEPHGSPLGEQHVKFARLHSRPPLHSDCPMTAQATQWPFPSQW